MKRTLSHILTSEGRVVRDADGDFSHHEYHMKDHLGNTRVVFTEDDGVIKNNDYYPFGMLMGGTDAQPVDGDNKFLYNGKEYINNTDLNLSWYDYGARFYDAQLGRWHSVDPLAESYYSQSPYHFSGNNPIRFIDSNGMNYGDYYGRDGSYLGSDGIDDDKAYVLNEGVSVNEERSDLNWGGELNEEQVDALQGASTELSITNSELNERAIWVFNECAGSDAMISEININADNGEGGLLGGSTEALGMTVNEVYANAINNAVNTDGSWTKTKSMRIGKMVNGKFTSTGNKLMAGEAPGGTADSRALANDYNSNGSGAFNNHTGANGARSGVISSVTSPKNIGGVRAWLGASDAKKYVNNANISTSRAKIQFSFSTRNGTFNHSFYRR